MHGKKGYKFKVINGVLSWKNEQMERFMPVSAEVLTRVILLYEKEFKNGIRIWNELKENTDLLKAKDSEDPLMQELAVWMEQLQTIFNNTDPYREKVKWMDDPIHLN